MKIPDLNQQTQMMTKSCYHLFTSNSKLQNLTKYFNGHSMFSSLLHDFILKERPNQTKSNLG